MLNIQNNFQISVLIFVTFGTILLTNAQHFRSEYSFYEEIQGSLKFHRVPATWRDALLQCQIEGAILASPLNENLLAATKKLTSNEFDIFTGIHTTVAKGNFVSVEGIPLSSSPIKWAPGEPENCDNKEGCLVQNKDGTIEDVGCNEVFPYVCYRKIQSYTACETTDKGYAINPKTGHCYKFHSVGVTWPRALMTCWSEGGYLTIINSEDEANFLKDLFEKHPSTSITSITPNVALIGFYDADNKFTWKTLLGETLQEAGYSQFDVGEPNNLGIQNCGAMFRNGKLDNISCNQNVAFICEKEPYCDLRLY